MYSYNQAYLSMKACPTAFLHPIQAGDLKGIGTRIVERLTQRLEEWCMQNNKPMPEVPARNGMNPYSASITIDTYLAKAWA
jgi:crossover junction endonuclease MUS81